MKPTRVLLVEDQHLLRAGLKLLLESDSAVTVGEASSAQEALSQLESHSYDIILMDLSLADMDGLRCIEAIRDRGCNTPILVVSMHEADHIVRSALAAGATGYVLKTVSASELRLALAQVQSGASYLQASLRHVLDGPAPVRPEARPLRAETPSLTRLERDVLQMSVRGLSSNQLREQLSLSECTLESHLRSLFRKLQVERLEQAVGRAIAIGLILPDPHGSRT